MKTIHALCWAALAAFIAGGQESILAQNEDIRIVKVQGERIETPEYSVKKNIPTVNLGSREKNWISISVLYSTVPTWIDELTITYYALLEPKDEPNVKYKLLALPVTYVNVGAGKHRGTAYMHPTTYLRYGAPTRVAAVIKAVVAGRTVEVASETTPWWTKLPSETGLLLNRNQTPFAFLHVNDLEAIKTETGK